MHRIRSLGVLSTAKMMGAIYAVVGLILMPFFLIAGMLTSMAGGHDNPFGAIGALAFGVMAPIFYGAIGFISGAIMAFLYNVMAKWLGGIEIELHGSSMISPPLG